MLGINPRCIYILLEKFAPMDRNGYHYLDSAVRWCILPVVDVSRETAISVDLRRLDMQDKGTIDEILCLPPFIGQRLNDDPDSEDALRRLLASTVNLDEAHEYERRFDALETAAAM